MQYPAASSNPTVKLNAPAVPPDARSSRSENPPYPLSRIALAIYAFTVIVIARLPELNTVSQLVGIGLAGVFAMEFLLTRRRVLILPGEMGSLAAFCLWCGVGLFWASRTSDVITLTTTLVQLLVLYVVSINVLAAQRSSSPISLGLIAGLVVACVYAIQNFGFEGELFQRVGSLQSDANQYALALGIGIMTTWQIFKSSGHYLIRITCIALILLFGHQIIFLTGSRTGTYSLLLVVGLNVLLGRGLTMKRSVASVFIALVSLIVGVIILSNVAELSPYAARFSNFEDSQSFSIRTRMINSGLGWWMENPIVGYGAGGFGVLWRGGFSHNNYVELLVNFGLLGALFYYGFFVGILRKAFKLRRAGRMDHSDFTWVVVVIALMLFWDLTLVNYYQKVFWILFAALNARTYNAEKLSEGSR